LSSRLAAIPCCILLVSTAATAGTLAPRRASDLVVVEAPLFADCAPQLGGSSAIFNTEVRPDGTTAPLSLPPNRALVVTYVELLGFGGTPGDNNQVRLWRGTDATGLEIFSQREAYFNADGRTTFEISFPTGVVIPAAGKVCVNDSDNVTYTGRLHGYLAPAK
jgi:hypothetical protein